MLRCGQMLLAESMLRLEMIRGVAATASEGEADATRRKVLSQFTDTPDTAAYAIHNVAIRG
jgi:hypothetical protein